ncbi:MAG: ferrochelatase, partial [Bryobacteraceae bacterium]
RAAVEAELAIHGPRLPVYWGNRNWHPFLTDTLRQMESDGIRRALAFVTSAFGSYSGCRQYLADIDRARAAAGPGAPIVEKLRGFYNHPRFLAAVSDRAAVAFDQIPLERRTAAELLFTAHSIPLAMAQTSPYVEQLEEACSRVAAALGRSHWRLVYQSRSGPPAQPWLVPDIGDGLRDLRANSGDPRDVVVVPIGFLSDHMEVKYDLDTEAQSLAQELGVNMVRAATAGTHPELIAMIRELIEERVNGAECHACPVDCCPTPSRL